jgi:hypothetical protein
MYSDIRRKATQQWNYLYNVDNIYLKKIKQLKNKKNMYVLMLLDM